MTVHKLPLKETLDQFAAAVWGPTDLIEVRALPSHRDLGPNPVSLWMSAGELPDHADRLLSMNKAELNIYAGVLPRTTKGGRTDADTLPGWIIWSDFDGLDAREAWKKATAKRIPTPTLAIDSGHGSHLYWGLNNQVEPAKLSRLVGGLAVFLGSDPSVKNPSRIMRLPGFMNLKEPVASCQLLHVEPQTRYDFDELRSIVPSSNAQKKGDSYFPSHAIPKPPGSPNRASLIERGRRYAAKVEGSTPGGRTHIAFRLAAALQNDLGLTHGEALPVLQEWDANANAQSITSDYGPDKLAEILQNAKKYHKKPQGHLLNTPPPREHSLSPKGRIPLPSEQKATATSLREEFEAEGRGARNTILLPWRRLTNITRALRPGTVTVLAAPSGYGKSIFVMQIAVYAHNQEVKFIYLILEDQKVDFERRLLAHIAGTWKVIDDNPEKAEWRKEILIQHKDRLTDLAKNVCENPRRPIIGSDGRPTVPPLPYQEVLDWLGRSVMSSRLVIIDPIAQIDFGEKYEWKGQADFMRHVTGLAAHSEASVILVAHTAKRGGRAGTIPLTGEDIQGAAEIVRLSHTILLMDAHDEKESTVWREGGRREMVYHDRTIIVDKARNASGRGNRLAYVMEGPAYRELGVITPKEAKNSPYGNGNQSERAYKD